MHLLPLGFYPGCFAHRAEQALLKRLSNGGGECVPPASSQNKTGLAPRVQGSPAPTSGPPRGRGPPLLTSSPMSAAAQVRHALTIGCFYSVSVLAERMPQGGPRGVCSWERKPEPCNVSTPRGAGGASARHSFIRFFILLFLLSFPPSLVHLRAP